MMLMLLLLSSLLHITTGSVYSVTPDDHYYPNTTCHHCHNLQHYLLNTTKYFTSNTQLLFLPGLHHLHTDLIIQNVHNISLIGSTTNGTTPDTVIQCNSSVGIVMTNVTNLIITNITVRSCLGNEYNNATVLIKQCTHVQLRHVVIEESHNSYGIVGINILGDSHFSYITNNAIIIIYNDTTVDMENHSLTMDHYQVNDVDKLFQQKINFKLHQLTYRVRMHLLNSIFHWLKNDSALFISFNNLGISDNVLLVNNCQFANSENASVRISLINAHHHNWQQINYVWFQNCEFFNNQILHETELGIIHIVYGPNVHINHCKFYHNYQCSVVTKVAVFTLMKFKVTISNTTFTSSFTNEINGLLHMQITELQLQGAVVFYNISTKNALIRLKNSEITCSKYIEFVNVTGRTILEHTHGISNYKFIYIFVKEGTTINVTNSKYLTFASKGKSLLVYGQRSYNYPPCYFQYLNYAKVSHGDFSIIFANNYENLTLLAYKDLPLVHCSWLPQSAFNTTMPLEVNKKYIKYINKSGTFDMLPQHIRAKTLCYCIDNNHYDCNKELLDPIYPGQTMMLNIYTNVASFRDIDTIITVLNNINWLSSTACVITNSSKMVQISKFHKCTTIKYTIAFPNQRSWCELFLRGLRDGTDRIDVYYVTEKPCPAGFIKIKGVCQCYPFLAYLDIKCNINDQTILRPANAWISPILVNKSTSYSFELSLHCPFHYCLPHSSHLDFSTPNSQCKFSRSGVLCGHCQQGLISVFGFSHCLQCSNFYLFLTLPMAIAGLLLVLLLFILNLTVTDGTINAFILYVNILVLILQCSFLSIIKSHQLTHSSH